MATGYFVDYDSGLPIVSSLDRDLYEIVNYGLAGYPRIDLMECYYINLNLQYDVDVSSSPLHIRHLHLYNCVTVLL